MEWFYDPSIWIGLLTLVLLEIVLGIDNLIFIAILAEKVPPEQRDRARLIGLSLAMLMRLALLAGISWLVTLTTPLFSFYGLSLSGRDMILLLGGIFLLFKATMELHERLEGQLHQSSGNKAYASLGLVIAQIVVLDAVFSLDSVITAVGMVEELAVMMAAVVISMAIMVLASKPLTRFVNAHTTVVVLCLSFLLMIGLSLVAEGLGFKIPKGYLYAAIGFSVVIEFFNQLARRNFMKNEARLPLRDRTAGAVLRLLGSRTREQAAEQAAAIAAEQEAAFGEEERNMVSGVLTLAERSIRSIMTPRSDVSWINLDDDADKISREIRATPHSFFPVARGQLDSIIGVARGQDLMSDLAMLGRIDEQRSLREAVILPGSVGVLKVMETLKRAGVRLVMVADEYGTIQGVVTAIDILEAIAGEFPDEDEQPTVQVQGDGHWRVDGSADLHHLEQVLLTDALVSEGDEFTSLAGFLLARFETLPAAGAAIELDGLRFEIAEVDDRRIACVDIKRIDRSEDEMD
ncbi:MAG: TerC family protein [Janthinobacterium lividum]